MLDEIFVTHNSQYFIANFIHIQVQDGFVSEGLNNDTSDDALTPIK